MFKLFYGLSYIQHNLIASAIDNLRSNEMLSMFGAWMKYSANCTPVRGENNRYFVSNKKGSWKCRHIRTSDRWLNETANNLFFTLQNTCFCDIQFSCWIQWLSSLMLAAQCGRFEYWNCLIRPGYVEICYDMNHTFQTFSSSARVRSSTRVICEVNVFLRLIIILAFQLRK